MDKKNFNSKSTPIQMRELIKRVRTGDYVGESKDNKIKKDMNMRDMLKITRKLNEDVNPDNKQNKKTVYDQTREEEKFRTFFNDMNVNIKFIDLEIYDDMIFWGGTVDGIIQFVYKVTPDESTSGVEFNYLEDFSPDNPENDEIIGRIESYYDTFYKYWRNNMLQTQ
jgi:hypothetical protein